MMSIMKNNALYLVYEYNNTLFENLFCENTDRPELDCHGKCMLAEMQNDQEKDDNSAHLLKQFQVELLYNTTAVDFKIPQNNITITTKDLFSPYENLYTFLLNDEDNIPPESFIS